ncbi:zinc ribbon domain-containing protein [Thioalkalivibrio sp. AKL6]|uniref:zinc ribbon domain-containing protein n=1 Tax=Thioalkalivibrio sp. AKL6 TaxID=1158154 RepID=UPI00039C7223|nr:zinc ribbon domain-containing protein [Thioalkalivibrio sp. AKL6]
MTEEDDATKYAERADFLEGDELYGWTVDHEYFRSIQRKIIQSGAKLLVGPRGSGKTHHFRYAHLSCKDNKGGPLTVYVSFTRYYNLEPYLRDSREALQIFHSWVLAKILIAVHEDFPDSYLTASEGQPALNPGSLREFIAEAERGADPSVMNKAHRSLSISQVTALLETVMVNQRRRRVVLMLDDAALVLTPEYMVEFFDIFRSLKTLKISPKASVYPGTTEYGPRFHADHDAEKVQAWLNVNDEKYGVFMERIARDRLGLTGDLLGADVSKLLAYAAFGIPRAFITMCRQFIDEQSQSVQQRFNKVINGHVGFRKSEYFSLADKTPQYRDIIRVGWDVFEGMVEEAKRHTEESIPERKATIIGLVKNDDQKRERMIRFLVEAGLLYELPPVSHGPDRDYGRFMPHYGFLIDRRAFVKGRGWSPAKIISGIEAPEKKHPIRRKMESILDADSLRRIELNLPACKDCGTERISDHQSYCHNCGARLIDPSIFEECMKIPVDELPITEKQKERIKSQTDIRTLGDIVSSADPASELRKARHIGEKRANKIYRLAKSVEEEFFS